MDEFVKRFMSNKISLPSRKIILICISIFSVVWGFIVCFIPWGPDNGLHGQGFPVPSLLWDNASRYAPLAPGEIDRFIDFPNPLAVIENPIVYFVFLILLWGFIEGIVWLIKKRNQ
jgi:hypothetical protein